MWPLAVIWLLPALLSHSILRALGTTSFQHQKGAPSGSWGRAATLPPFPLDSASSGLLSLCLGRSSTNTLPQRALFYPSGSTETSPWKTLPDHPVLNHTLPPILLHPPSRSCPPQHLIHSGVTLPTFSLCVVLAYLGHPGWCQAHRRCSVNTH